MNAVGQVKASFRPMGADLAGTGQAALSEKELHAEA
jgi:hypothetical protein